MPLLFLVVPYVIAGGVMWFVSSLLAPYERDIKLWQAVVAVILIGLLETASRHWLTPLIGDWTPLVNLVLYAAVVMLVLHLSFWRSLVAVLAYVAVILIAILVMRVIAKSGNP